MVFRFERLKIAGDFKSVEDASDVVAWITDDHHELAQGEELFEFCIKVREVGFFDDGVCKFNAVHLKELTEADGSCIDVVIVRRMIVIKVVQIQGDFSVGSFTHESSDDRRTGLLVTHDEDGVITDAFAPCIDSPLGIDASDLQAMFDRLDGVAHERLEFACHHDIWTYPYGTDRTITDTR